MSENARDLLVKILVDTANADKGFKSVSEKVSKLDQTTKNASKDVKELGKNTETAGKHAKDTATKTDTLSKSLDKSSEATKKANSVTKEFSDQIKGLTAPLTNVNSGLNVFKGVLGAFGVSVGLNQVADKISEMAKKSKETVENYKELQQSFITISGRELTDSERAIIGKISTETGFGLEGEGKTKTDLSGIMARILALSPGISGGDLEKLTIQYGTMGQLFGTDSQFVVDSIRLMQSYGIGVSDYADSLAYLGSVSQKYVIPISDLMSALSDDTMLTAIKESNLSIQNAAAVIGEGYIKNLSSQDILNLLSISADLVKGINITADYGGYTSINPVSDDDVKWRKLAERAADIQAGKGTSLANSADMEAVDRYSKLLGGGTSGTFLDSFKAQDAIDTIIELTDDAIIPMNDNLLITSDNQTLINELSTEYNDMTINQTIPTLNNETAAANSLAAAWRAAAAAKREYNNT